MAIINYLSVSCLTPAAAAAATAAMQYQRQQQRRSDTCRMDMQRAFPGPTATLCCSSLLKCHRIYSMPFIRLRRPLQITSGCHAKIIDRQPL